MKIRKYIDLPRQGRMSARRLQIKEFKYSDDGHNFLNKQDNNDWQVYDGPLKSGQYAYAGGEWHNVKNLDSSVLAHI